MRVFVINLPRSVERREHMESQLRGLDHEFVPAIDGTTLREPRPDWVRPGIAGSTASHLAVYRHVVARRFPHALVLEDDAVLPDDLDELLGALPPHLDGREVALLYYRSFRECPLSGDGVRLPGDRLLADPLDPSLPIGGTAYAITREACEAMIELPHHEPDAWGQFVANGGIERLRCVHPRPVGERLDFASTLGYGGTLAQLVPAQLRTWRREWLERRMSRFPLAE